MPSNEEWFEFKIYEYFIKIRRRQTMVMKIFKDYFIYLMNEYINNETKIICEVIIHIHKIWRLKRRDVGNVPDVPKSQNVCQICLHARLKPSPNQFFGTRPSGKLPVKL